MLASVDRIIADLAGKEEHRRVVFIAFTGEERGLLGSAHYVKNPRFPLESTVAMINLDMVGRLRDNDLTVYGTGTSPSFEELLDRARRPASRFSRSPAVMAPATTNRFTSGISRCSFSSPGCMPITIARPTSRTR
jgi:Zn-dependent M28 family amino/carboxypeptidase